MPQLLFCTFSLFTLITMLLRPSRVIYIYMYDFFPLGRCGPTQAMVFSFLKLKITHNDALQSVGLPWTSDRLVAETSAWQPTTIRQTFMPPAEFEPTIPASEWPQTYVSDRAATGTGMYTIYACLIYLSIEALLLFLLTSPLFLVCFVQLLCQVLSNFFMLVSCIMPCL